MSIAMQRIATLEQTVEDLSQKLIDKVWMAVAITKIAVQDFQQSR